MELKKCPYCGKSILAIAKVCKHCGKRFEQQVQNVPKQKHEQPKQSVENPQPIQTPIVLQNHKSRSKTNSTKIILIVIAVVIALVALIVVVVNSLSDKKTQMSQMNLLVEEVTEPVYDEQEVIETPEYDKVEIITDFPNEQQIKDFIRDYYEVLQNKEYYKITDYYAEIVPRFFKKTNVANTEIRDGQIKYHEQTLKTISVTPSVRWNTFEIIDKGNIAEISFIMDYYLNTERYGNQKYVLKVKIDINNDYKIVGISEDRLEKENL
jgi:hypothetical protein